MKPGILGPTVLISLDTGLISLDTGLKFYSDSGHTWANCSNFFNGIPGIVHYFVHVVPGIPNTVKPGILGHRKSLLCKENPRVRAICFNMF